MSSTMNQEPQPQKPPDDSNMEIDTGQDKDSPATSALISFKEALTKPYPQSICKDIKNRVSPLSTITKMMKNKSMIRGTTQ